jgi:SAM-dependent methyltransferase
LDGTQPERGRADPDTVVRIRAYGAYVGACVTDAKPQTGGRLQTEVLETLSDAWRYRRWLADLALPYLGDDPIEIGSGLGGYAAEWARRVPRLTASEADAGRLVELKDRFADVPGVCVRQLALPADEVAEHSAAVAVNVLEHVPDDVGALRSMAALVRPGGAVVIIVPAFPFLMSAFDRAIGHVRRYTRRATLLTLERAGLRPEVVRYVNPIGVFSWLLAVRALGITPRNGTLIRMFDAVAVPPQRFLERYVAPPFGQSVFAVAHTAAH